MGIFWYYKFEIRSQNLKYEVKIEQEAQLSVFQKQKNRKQPNFLVKINYLLSVFQKQENRKHSYYAQKIYNTYWVPSNITTT